MVRPAVPLADVHTHLYGSIQPADYLEFVRNLDVDWDRYEAAYYAAYGVPAPLHDILGRYRSGEPAAEEEFRRLFVFGDDDAGNFQRFQAKMNMIVGIAGEIRTWVHKIIGTQQRQSVRYAEQRELIGAGLKGAQAKDHVTAILEEYAKYANSEFEPRLAPSLPRGDPWPSWEITKELALGPNGHLLTGIDFCYLEEGHPPKEKNELFAEVRDFNRRHPERALAILYHVGESFEDKSLESAIRWVHEAAELGAHRVGHAIALGIDPDVYGQHQRTEPVGERIDQILYDVHHAQGLRRHGVNVNLPEIQKELAEIRALPSDSELARSYDHAGLDEVRGRQRYAMESIRSLGTIVEVCPTSNRRIGGISSPHHHPVHRFIENDVPFVVASDDPGIFDTTLADEIGWVVQAAGLGADAFDEIAERSWRYRSEVLTGRVAQA